MMLSNDSRTLLRLAGALTIVAVGLFLPFCSGPSRPLATIAAMVVFAGAFWGTTEPGAAFDRLRGAMIGAQSLVGIGLVLMHPYFLMASLLVVVGWQAALFFPLLPAMALVVGQSCAAGAMLSAFVQPGLLWPSLLATVGFQIYGLAAAGMARGEASARADLAATIGQLRVAQAGLAERARAEERLRIARDLHDELGHGLTALELGLGDLGRRAEAQPGLDALTQAIREAGGLSRDLLERVRAVVTGMRGPPAASIDLAAALRDLVAATAGAPGPEVRLSGEAPFAQVDSGRAEVVLRAAQEAITNSRRHAGPASRLDLELSLTSSGALRLTATDDGAGARQARGGSGLDGMRERATALGGAVAVDTAPGEGFRLRVELPRRGET